MLPSRARIVHIAYNKLDKDNSGSIDIKELKEFYKENFNLDIMTGKRTVHDLQKEFLSNFNDNQTQKDKKCVSESDFFQYYHNLSFCVVNNAKFEDIVKDAWCLSVTDLSISDKDLYRDGKAPFNNMSYKFDRKNVNGNNSMLNSEMIEIMNYHSIDECISEQLNSPLDASAMKASVNSSVSKSPPKPLHKRSSLINGNMSRASSRPVHANMKYSLADVSSPNSRLLTEKDRAYETVLAIASANSSVTQASVICPSSLLSANASRTPSFMSDETILTPCTASAYSDSDVMPVQDQSSDLFSALGNIPWSSCLTTLASSPYLDTHRPKQVNTPLFLSPLMLPLVPTPSAGDGGKGEVLDLAPSPPSRPPPTRCVYVGVDLFVY